MSGARFTPEELGRLEVRANRLLERDLLVRAVAQQTSTLLLFRRGSNRLALPARDLLGVRAMPKICRLPGLPAHVAGVAYLNGHALGVLDLERLEKPAAPLPSYPWSIWVQHDDQNLLLVADELIGLLEAPLRPLSGGPRGAFAGPIAERCREILPGPVLVLEKSRLVEDVLFNPLDR
ncbi:MAG: chemotaxis protein CheW [Myxococcales bacterium]